jgi:hypothetical protein
MLDKFTEYDNKVGIYPALCSNTSIPLVPNATPNPPPGSAYSGSIICLLPNILVPTVFSVLSKILEVGLATNSTVKLLLYVSMTAGLDSI